MFSINNANIYLYFCPVWNRLVASFQWRRADGPPWWRRRTWRAARRRPQSSSGRSRARAARCSTTAGGTGPRSRASSWPGWSRSTARRATCPGRGAASWPRPSAYRRPPSRYAVHPGPGQLVRGSTTQRPPSRYVVHPGPEPLVWASTTQRPPRGPWPHLISVVIIVLGPIGAQQLIIATSLPPPSPSCTLLECIH